MKLIIFFCLIVNVGIAQKKIKFDTENRILTIQITDSCKFNSAYALTFTDDYTYFISQEKDFLYFLSELGLYGNNPFEYEISVLVFKCPYGRYTCNETIKIPSKRALRISLEESLLIISDDEIDLILELRNVTSEEINEFRKQLEYKFN